MKIKAYQDFLINRLDDFYNAIFFNNYHLTSLTQFDKSFVKKFSNYNFVEKYINLINGLDEESITIVNLIIARCQLFNSGIRMFALTANEIPKLKEYAIELKNNIIKLSDSIWAYKHYLLPNKLFIPTIFIEKHFLYKLKNLDSIKNKDIIDAGAYIGDSALIFSEYTDKNVYAFEPISTLYNQIYTTIKLNKLNNVKPIKKGLGDKTEIKSISLDDINSSIIFSNSTQKEKIDLITLDDFVNKHKLDVGLIKVDIEGYEMNMLLGAKETIKKQKPALLISIYHSFEDFFNIKTEIDSWELGYKFKIAKPNDFSFYCDTTLIAEVY